MPHGGPTQENPSRPRQHAPEAPQLLALPQVVPQIAEPSSRPRADGSFDAFYRHTYPRLVRYLARLADRSISEDVAQTVMMAACQKWETLSTYDRPDAWAFKVARRELQHHQYLEVRHGSRLPPANTIDEASPDRLVDPELDVASALKCLPSRQAEIIKLHVLHGYSRAEVAAILNISVSSVNRDLRAGLSYLRERLSSWHDPNGT
jgi:RNA polymerase sigma factor (sigma-70 family)